MAVSGAGSASACSDFLVNSPSLAFGLTGASNCRGPAVAVLGPASSGGDAAVSVTGPATGRYAVSGTGSATGCDLVVSPFAPTNSSCGGGGTMVGSNGVTVQGNKVWPPPAVIGTATLAATISYAPPGFDPTSWNCTNETWTLSSVGVIAGAIDTADSSKVELANLIMTGNSCDSATSASGGVVSSVSLSAVLTPGPGSFSCSTSSPGTFLRLGAIEITVPVSCTIDGTTYPVTLRYAGSWTPVFSPGSTVVSAATAGTLAVTPV
jgi:hypothetical protein